MHIYDTVIIGSGYSSVGFALGKGNCIICEQTEVCDRHFYLPMKGFSYSDYKPKTEEGIRLHRLYSEMKLFNGNLQNINGFETGLCSYLEKTDINILLKCRVVNISNDECGLCMVTIITNSGLEELCAKNIIDLRGNFSSYKKFITVLFISEDIQADEKALKKVFEGSQIEKAFYTNRYAIYIPADDFENVNTMKIYIHNKWTANITNPKILYIAPVFGIHSPISFDKTLPFDDLYLNPIEAFEAGYLYAKEKS